MNSRTKRSSERWAAMIGVKRRGMRGAARPTCVELEARRLMAVDAVSDFYTGPSNTVLSVPQSVGVLANDSATFPDTLPLHASLVAGGGPVHGTLKLTDDGSFTYTPAAQFSGTDSFVYQAVDSTGTTFSAPTTVNLVVNNSIEPPQANPDAYTGQSNTPLAIPARGVLANDFSPQGGPLTAEQLAAPSHGSLVLDPTNGSFTYTPNPNFIGTDVFTYRARDAAGLSSDPTTVTLNIGVTNLAPTASDDQFTAAENKSLFVVGPGVLANDADPNGDLLSASLVTAPTHGTLQLGGDGSVSYTPDPNFHGIDTFTYRAFDGKLASNTATVTIVVAQIPIAPIANNDNYVGTEDAPLTVPASGAFVLGVLANDQQIDGDPLTAGLVDGPLHAAAFTLNPDGSFTYVPQPLFFGTDTFTYRATDTLTGLVSGTATVTIGVAHVNHAPTSVDDSFTTRQDTPLAVAAPGLLANDSDVDGDLLSAVLKTGPAHGTVTLNSDGSFVYTPTAAFVGTDSFTYVTSDGKRTSATAATVTLTVTSEPKILQANPDSFAILQGGVLQVASPGLLLNDANPNGLPVNVRVINGPLHGSLVAQDDGTLTYTPDPAFAGTDVFSYYLQAAPGSGSTLRSGAATVTVTVVPVNHVPVATNDAFVTNENGSLFVAAPGVLQNDTDVDNDQLTAVLQTNPTNGTLTLNADGSFVYTPLPFFSGTDSFTYRVSDGKSVGNLATVSLTITPVVLAPIAGNDSYAIQASQRLVVPAPGVLGNDSDPNGRPLSVVLVNAPQGGSVALNLDGSFTYTPSPNFAGNDSFTYRAGNGFLLSNLATVNIVVAAIAPTTATLSPASDTGVSNSDRITKDSTPTFMGTTSPGLTVTLYGRAAGDSAAPIPLGTTTADSLGNYVITSIPLPDGPDEFFIEAVRADGLSTGRIAAGNLTIDTVGPKVANTLLVPRLGQIYVTFQDDRSGMDLATATEAGNYSFLRVYTLSPRSSLVSVARTVGDLGSTTPQTVVLTIANGRRTPHGRYILGIVSAGITDLAGNALDGEFNQVYPSGDGQPGGHFNGKFLNNGQKLVRAVPTGLFVPIVTGQAVPGPIVLPHRRSAPSRPITTPVRVQAAAPPIVAASITELESKSATTHAARKRT